MASWLDPMYSQIESNRNKTWILMAGFIVLILAIGFAFDVTSGGNGTGGIILAVIVSLGMTAVSYFSGDRVSLWAAGAKLVEKRDAPLLYRTVENLSIASGMPMPKIYLIPDPAINAFATGRDPQHASIAVTTGCLDRLENEELEGVIAHELSHIKNYDIRIMMVVVVLVGTIALLSDWIFRARWYGVGRRDNDRNGQGQLIIFAIGILLAVSAPIVAEVIKLAISRRREYLADASGALLTRYPEGLARALEKIAASSQPILRANTATAHLYIANPFGAKRHRFTALFSTHPPIEERVKALRAMAV